MGDSQKNKYWVVSFIWVFKVSNDKNKEWYLSEDKTKELWSGNSTALVFQLYNKNQVVIASLQNNAYSW